MYTPVKRIIDLLLATIALIALSPLLILCIIILLFTGEHEVFFKQQRVGFKNRSFGIWKFATMLKNSPNMGSGEITLRNDPRVTPFGRLLRISKLNEIPQIFNVFSGEMSIVGPRPLMAVSFSQYSEKVKAVIYNNKPGMTGIGSLIFRDEEKLVSDAQDSRTMYTQIYAYKGELELWYLQHISFYTDTLIILLTAWSIVAPQNKLVFRLFKDLPPRPF